MAKTATREVSIPKDATTSQDPQPTWFVVQLYYPADLSAYRKCGLEEVDPVTGERKNDENPEFPMGEGSTLTEALGNALANVPPKHSDYILKNKVVVWVESYAPWCGGDVEEMARVATEDVCRTLRSGVHWQHLLFPGPHDHPYNSQRLHCPEGDVSMIREVGDKFYKFILPILEKYNKMRPILKRVNVETYHVNLGIDSNPVYKSEE